MKKTKLLAAILAAVMVLSSLSGCSNSETEKETNTSSENNTQTESEAENTESDKEMVFNRYTNSVIVGLNPILNTSAPDNRAHDLIAEPLVREVTAPGNQSEIIPAAAETWEISDDGLTYTFHLREGAKWSDGVDFTAGDFEYTLKLMADPAVGSTNAWLFDGIIVNFGEALYSQGKTPDEIGVTAIDDTTLEIKLVHPASYTLELLSSLYPVRQDKYEEWGDSYGSSVEKSLCSGPFMVESWNQNTEFVVVKNPYHWNVDGMKLDKIVDKVIQEPATAIQAFINGEIDVVGTSDPNWASVIEDANVSTTETVPSSAPEFLMFNLENKYLSNAKIRQALSIAYDRIDFVETLFNGQALPIYSVMPDSMMIGDKPYTELVEGKNYFVTQLQDENPDPKALLAEGLKELGLSEDPSQVTIRYASRGTSELSKKMAEWYKQTWENALGITVDIEMMEWNIMWDRIDAGDFDIAVGGWGPYYNEPSAILTLFHPDNGYFNADKIGWYDKSADQFKALCEKAVTVTDQKELANIYLEAEEILVKNAIISPEYLSSSPTFISNRVHNYYVSTNGYINWANVTVD